MAILSTDPANADQIAYWDGPGGKSWVAREAIQEASLAPITGALLMRAAAQPSEQVVDVGCGTGPTTEALARRVGPAGRVLAIDVSEPMLERARARLAGAGSHVELVQADATTYAFPPSAFDLVVSRFGVMFFAEPAKSFANLRRALRKGGRLAFVCWRRGEENPWMTVPLRAVLQHVPPPPPPGPEDPGPLSFASAARVKRILGEAGFEGVALEPHDFEFEVGRGLSLEEAAALTVTVGPASRLLAGQPQQIISAATQSVRGALAPFLRDSRIALPAATWIVTTRNP